MLQKLIHAFPPEMAHNIGLAALHYGALGQASSVDDPRISQELLGLLFKNPVGLAAGFDKNAYAIAGLLKQGFGFIECGTVTPLAQSGNPKPRVFRLHKDAAVINRLGFNNHGVDAFVKNFQQRDAALGVVGANIGKNKSSNDAIADYVTCLTAVYAHADYVTINISSPNTEGLRDLQHADALDALLGAIMQCRASCAVLHGTVVPILLKVAPDLTQSQREHIAELLFTHHVDGLIVSNTTVSRPNALRSDFASETGGLSGAPLKPLAHKNVAQFYHLLRGRIPIIGVGGIGSAEDAYARMRAGASLIQLYTALVYQGFPVVRSINSGVCELLDRDGISHISEIIGIDAL